MNFKSELSSCLQKSIRRNDLIGLKCAAYLYDLSPENNHKKIWQKMEVFTAEDLGRAAPHITTFLLTQQKKFLEEEDSNRKRYIFLNTVNSFLNCKTSRIADDANHAFFKASQPEIPHADDLSKLVSEFKSCIVNDVKDWNNADRAIKLASRIYIDHKEEKTLLRILARNSSNMTDKDYNELECLIKMFTKWNKICRNKTDVLFLVNLILLQTWNYNNENDTPHDIFLWHSNNELSMEAVNQIFEEINNEKLSESSFPDWVYDKHTKKGRNLHRGMLHFYEVSAYLKNPIYNNPYEPIAKKNNTK